MTASSVIRRQVILARDVHIRLVSLLAGRAAEEVLLGEASSGAGGGPGSDLARATILALHSSQALGLDPETGLLWSGDLSDNQVSKLLASDRQLAERVNGRLAEAYGQALALVESRKAAVIALADALVERGALDASEIGHILAAATSGAPGAGQPTTTTWSVP